MDRLVRDLGLERFEQFDAGDTMVERSPNKPPLRTRGYVNSPASMRLVGGMGALVDALRRHLDGTRIITGQTVRRLRSTDQHVELDSIDASGRVATWRAGQVLLAMPPRLIDDIIEFTPALPQTLARQWRATATWMAPHAKYIAVYDPPFWRERGLSGEARSSRGPLGEIHDASMPGGSAALFGFFGMPARVPGHEVVGRIAALGANTPSIWKLGQRVGVGRLGSHCNECDQCRRGQFHLCRNQPAVGSSQDGGYAEMMLARSTGLVSIPDELYSEEAAPILCAGLATFNALRRSGAQAGDLVATQGIGGLGHLAVQYARKMGFKVVAVGRGTDIASEVLSLGAHVHIDTGTENATARLQAMGGAQVILTTITKSDAVSSLMPALAPHGKLLVAGVGKEPLTVLPGLLVAGERMVQGTITGTPFEYERNMFPLVNTLGMVAAEAAYSHGEPWLEEMLAYLRGNHAHFANAINGATAKIEVLPADSLYLAWMDCHGLGMDAEALDKFMLTRARLWLDKGQKFGIEGHGYMRVNLGCPRATVDEAISRLTAALAGL